MALSRRSGARFQSSIWPGFVDAMTALLLVLMFVLSIFMIVQFMLRETISGQQTELDELSAQVASLADALGLERDRASALEGEVGALSASLASAQDQNAELGARVRDFEAQVARLLAERDTARDRVAALEGQVSELAGNNATLEQALASVRTELDASTEAARLAAARREALEALMADLRRRNAEAGAEGARLAADLAAAQQALSEEEMARLAEAEAARLLRERLQDSETELTALTLALEEERRRAEETLTLLAAADAAREALQARTDTQLTEAEKQAALLAVAQSKLAEQEAASAEAERRVALLNQQIAALRDQLGGLQGLLDAADERDRDARVQIESLGTRLNAALAQVADEQRRRADLEEAERKRLEAQNLELERYRSDFFGKLREVLADREGVRVVGDRFVFSSEVLFQPGSADLAPEGQSQIASVAALLLDVAREIPPEVSWILRVDGHTDITPLSRSGRYADNWELSQARALSVVRFMVEELDFPADRLAATGFGEFQPVAQGTDPEALAQNRRIELKLTER